MSNLLDEASHEHVALDYAGAKGLSKLLKNLSGAAAIGAYLWTVSDEGRRLECLIADGQGYRLHSQFKLDALFDHIAPGKECDLEDIAIEHGRLWLLGSHCDVRLESHDKHRISPRMRQRLSRNFLGSIALERDGSAPKGAGIAIAAKGKGSLRRAFRGDAYLDPFLRLPSKENGLDIEGCALLGERMLLGLRGPVLDSHAIVLDLACRSVLPVTRRRPRRHFLDLGGFGVRGLTRHGASLLVLAGPVTAAPGAFRIHRWRPGAPDRVQKPDIVHEFPIAPDKPEGLCVLRRGDRDGLLIVYDGSNKARRDGTRYLADWYAFA
ncbi:MAG: DUF3616 domain-containing protein [Rhizobiales bacterium]|nr:DUF3616 domain-containing protein [Hyphomicrobiales bacterium]